MLSLFILTGAGFAQTIGFQSYILDDDEPLADGQYNITFRIYDQAVGGGAIWHEMQEVTVSGGVVSAELGSVGAINTLPFNKTYWVSLQLPDREEMGRLKLSHSPYAINAISAQAPYYYHALSGEDSVEPEERNDDLISVTVLPPPISSLEDEDFSGIGLWCHAILDTDRSTSLNLRGGGVTVFFTVFDRNDQDVTNGFTSGDNPYMGGFMIDPVANPGPYRVQFGIESTLEQTTLRMDGIILRAQWGVLFTP